ncbi:MAG: hypothetical protein OEW75_18775 [Cyclobacteriaceae bacterium]|nr:hypothetical protein [Cyclobacteriaceae bacterium]
MSKTNTARNKYRPEQVKLLFIAEAPPCSDDRFFYFEEVPKGDSLFLHIIREVFPETREWETKVVRARKEELLLRFMEEGYFLEDAVSIAIPKGTSINQKISMIKDHQQDLFRRLMPYKEVPMVLLSATVFKANHEFLKQHFSILNKKAIPFPGSGQQGNFIREFRDLEL